LQYGAYREELDFSEPRSLGSLEDYQHWGVRDSIEAARYAQDALIGILDYEQE
jgi:hypothetical protein